LCLLGQIPRASPVPVFCGVSGFIQKGVHFRCQVDLHGVQPVALRRRQILSCHRNALIHLLLRRGYLLFRKLWSKQWRVRLRVSGRFGSWLRSTTWSQGLPNRDQVRRWRREFPLEIGRCVVNGGWLVSWRGNWIARMNGDRRGPLMSPCFSFRASLKQQRNTSDGRDLQAIKRRLWSFHHDDSMHLMLQAAIRCGTLCRARSQSENQSSHYVAGRCEMLLPVRCRFHPVVS